MSTIHDALKKVQDNMTTPSSESPDTVKPAAESPTPPRPRNPFNPPPVAAPRTAQEPEHPKEGPKKILFILLILIIVTSIGAGLAMILRGSKLEALRHKFSFSLARKKTPPRITAPPPIKPGEIKLQGILSVNGSQAALINHEIYHSGDTVKGQTILNITKTDVLIRDENGQETTMRVAP